ncbi:MAG: hypothetical protein CMJ06_03500, partial [Pelagibacterales bacterium]
MQDFINTIIKRKIVCPHPICWSRIFSILKKNNKENIYIPTPLILGGWWQCDYNKQKIFIQHISIAEKLGVLDQIKRYISKLNDKDLCFHDKDELVYEEVVDPYLMFTHFDDINKEAQDILKQAVPILLNLEKSYGELNDDSLNKLLNEKIKIKEIDFEIIYESYSIDRSDENYKDID